MMTISVIIPVHNATTTLVRCLRSVLFQTYRPFEIIVIDDGSTDSSLAILQDYAVKYPQLHVLSQTNHGVSSARNAGIEAATGDWLMFLDADDYLAPTALERLVQETGGEMSLAGLTIHTSEKTYNQNLYQKNATQTSDGVLTDKEAISILSYYTFCGPVCKLYRTDIIKRNNIRFPSDLSFGEDTVFVYTYLKYAKLITIHNEHLYHCDKSNQCSLTATVNSASRVNSIMQIYPVMREVYLSKNLPLHYVDYIYLDALQTATNLSYKDEGLTSGERIKIYQSMFANENFNTLKAQCSPVFIFLGRIHAWHLCDLYLKFRTH